MKLSKYYLPIFESLSSEIVAKSHILMLRSGLIRQNASGLYTILPLGLRVLQKIEKIIQEELDKIDCQRLNMPILQPKSLWEETGRDAVYGPELLRIKDRHGNDLFYSPTAEEMVVDTFRANIISYKHLPMNLYQINWKFRDEIRPRFGLLRAREFYMMDSYSFHCDYEDARKAYYQMYECYMNIFARCGVVAIPMNADTGQIGGSLSHEFQVLAESGESTVFYEKKIDTLMQKEINSDLCKQIMNCYASTEEKHNPSECSVAEGELCVKKGIEVGQIFYLGQKYTQAMNVAIDGPNGEKITPEMCTYGIGVTRLMSAIIEASHDDKGIIWPKNVAPFDVILINLDTKDEQVNQICNDLYNRLNQDKVDVLYDDTHCSAGIKFNKADLLGIPYQIIIGKRGVANNQFETKERASNIRNIYNINDYNSIFDILKN
jgi:prolyl-tRNA synthetase